MGYIEEKLKEIKEYLEKVCYPKNIEFKIETYSLYLTERKNTDIILRYSGRQDTTTFNIYQDDISYIEMCIKDAIQRISEEPPVINPKVFIAKYDDYIKHDIAATIKNSYYGAWNCSPVPIACYMPKPKKIILNDPATIILWSDGTKTIVKKNSKDRKFDPEKGIALCYMKRALGNKGNYNNVFRDWIK